MRHRLARLMHSKPPPMIVFMLDSYGLRATPAQHANWVPILFYLHAGLHTIGAKNHSNSSPTTYLLDNNSSTPLHPSARRRHRRQQRRLAHVPLSPPRGAALTHTQPTHAPDAANAAALRCAAAFLDMRHPSADLARRVDEFLARSALRTLPGAVTVLRSCEAPDDDLLRAAAEELGVARRAADAAALAVGREALFPTTTTTTTTTSGSAASPRLPGCGRWSWRRCRRARLRESSQR